MQNICKEARDKINLEITPVELAMQHSQGTARNHQIVFEHRESNRLATFIPPSLRTTYESGTWKNSNVCMCSAILRVTNEGYENASLAHDGLSHLSGKGIAPSEIKVLEHHKLVSDALQESQRIAPR